MSVFLRKVGQVMCIIVIVWLENVELSSVILLGRAYNESIHLLHLYAFDVRSVA